MLKPHHENIFWILFQQTPPFTDLECLNATRKPDFTQETQDGATSSSSLRGFAKSLSSFINVAAGHSGGFLVVFF